MAFMKTGRHSMSASAGSIPLDSIRKPTYRKPNMKPACENHLPLSPATMHVLLALTSGELHGYGIMLEVARQSAGAYKIGPGTLYDNLKKLLADGLVEEASSKGSGRDSRREYRITPFGCEVLSAETRRLSQVIKIARRNLRLSEGKQA
jgi:DNA-binding PadR family transcriptional regulator